MFFLHEEEVVLRRKRISTTHVALDLPYESCRVDTAELKEMCTQVLNSDFCAKVIEHIGSAQEVMFANPQEVLAYIRLQFTSEQRFLGHVALAIGALTYGRILLKMSNNTTGYDQLRLAWAHAKCGALVSAELAQAYYIGDRSSRFDVLNLPMTCTGLEEDRWGIVNAGAVALARTMYLFDRIGYDVYLPTLAEDVHDKIDLIACVADARPNFCIQVKGSNSGTKFVYHTFYDAFGRISEADKRFLQGVRKVNDVYRGVYEPIVVEVRTGSYDALSVEPKLDHFVYLLFDQMIAEVQDSM